MAEKGVNHWKTPAESPNVNPIEMFWNELKYHLRKRVKPSNSDELASGIVDWVKCTKYI